MSFASLQNMINLSLGRFYLFETIGDCQSYSFDSLNGSVWLFWFSFDLSIIGDDVINWEICRFDQCFLDFTIILAHDDDDNLEAKRKNDDDDFDHREGFRELVFGSLNVAFISNTVIMSRIAHLSLFKIVVFNLLLCVFAPIVQVDESSF